jgi:hypothetical protein
MLKYFLKIIDIFIIAQLSSWISLKNESGKPPMYYTVVLISTMASSSSIKRAQIPKLCKTDINIKWRCVECNKWISWTLWSPYLYASIVFIMWMHQACFITEKLLIIEFNFFGEEITILVHFFVQVLLTILAYKYGDHNVQDIHLLHSTL